MSALPPEQASTMRRAAKEAAHPIATLADRWAEVHRQAAEIAGLAGLAAENDCADAQAFAALVKKCADYQQTLVWQGTEDIAALLQPGLAALRTLTARGQDACVPALALWREFYEARQAILSALHPEASRKAA